MCTSLHVQLCFTCEHKNTSDEWDISSVMMAASLFLWMVTVGVQSDESAWKCTHTHTHTSKLKLTRMILSQITRNCVVFCSFFTLVRKCYYLWHRSNSDGNILPSAAVITLLMLLLLLLLKSCFLSTFTSITLSQMRDDDLCNLGHGKCCQHSDSVRNTAG